MQRTATERKLEILEARGAIVSTDGLSEALGRRAPGDQVAVIG
jgi:hypothetical protein